MGSEEYRVDVCACGSDQSYPGYPKYGLDQVHAHAIAEDAARELEESATPGEYVVAVSLHGKTPLATQVVLVPSVSTQVASE